MIVIFVQGGVVQGVGCTGAPGEETVKAVVVDADTDGAEGLSTVDGLEAEVHEETVFLMEPETVAEVEAALAGQGE